VSDCRFQQIQRAFDVDVDELLFAHLNHVRGVQRSRVDHGVHLCDQARNQRPVGDAALVGSAASRRQIEADHFMGLR